MDFNQLLRSVKHISSRQIVRVMCGWTTEAANREKVITLTQGATVAVDAAKGNVQRLTLTTGADYQLSTPTNPPGSGLGQLLTLIVTNGSGGASGVGSFGGGYTAAGNIPILANGETFSASFYWSGSSWVETSRTNGTGTGALVFADVTLTNAQIKALPSTPVDILPAPGVGFAWYVLGGVVTVDTNVDATRKYTGISANAALELTGSFYQTAISNDAGLAITQVNDLLGAGAVSERTWQLQPQTLNYAALAAAYANGYVAFENVKSTIENVAVQMTAFNAADFTGGNAANTMTVNLLAVKVRLT